MLNSNNIEQNRTFHIQFDLHIAPASLKDIQKQNIPSHNLQFLLGQNKDLKQMAHHRKKVAGHKLDYDCKKRHGTQGTEMVESEKKFADSYKVNSFIFIHFFKNISIFAGSPAEYE